MKSIVRIIATFFYIGHLPLAPGSAASAATVLLSIGLSGNPLIYVIVFLVLTALGFWASDRMEKIAGEKDPSFVVIDEVSGMMIALFLLPVRVPVLITAFFLFRAFDMFKIYPVNRLEKLKGGVGVMMDDIAAGLYTNVIMHIVLYMMKVH